MTDGAVTDGAVTDGAVTPWAEAHDRAVHEGRPTYRDPASGYHVFTEAALAARGRCCGSGCRHCPYGHVAVDGPRPERAPGRPSFRVRGGPASERPADVLFWSGGKDSFLAWRALRRAGRHVVWLTTYDMRHDLVAHQEVSRAQIEAQARGFGVDLVMVPLTPAVPYEDAVFAGIDAIRRVMPVARLAFGDLHLEEIRSFREATFGPWAEAEGLALVFPLWRVPYAELQEELRRSGARVTLSAAPAGHGVVGQAYDEAFVASLPEGVDRFGENGEFHTYVAPPEGTA